MTKNIENTLSLNGESRNFYDLNYKNRYEILRNRTQIKFLDYNLLQVIKTFHIKDKSSDLTNSDTNLLYLFALPEEYNIKRVLTHNLNIFLNVNKMDIMESTNENLKKLNHCHMINKANEYIEKVDFAMNELDKIAKSELNWSFKRIYKEFKKKGIFTKFKNTLFNYLRSACSDYLKPKKKTDIPQQKIFNTLEDGKFEVTDYIKRMHRKIKIKKHLIAEKIVRFTKSLRSLMGITNIELIAIDLPKDFYNSSKNIEFFPYKENHFTIVIKTEESILNFIEYYNFSWIRSFF